MPNPARAFWRIIALLVAVVATAALSARAQPAAPSESQLKAAFLVNFPKYVEWPADVKAETNSTSPLVIASIGETPLSNDLRALIQGKTVNGRPVVYKVRSESDNLADCHVLFIPDSERRRILALLEKLKGSNVLTVGESDDFLEKGGVINLARRDRKVRLEVNLETARQAGLKISSKLLGVADVVKGK